MAVGLLGCGLADWPVYDSPRFAGRAQANGTREANDELEARVNNARQLCQAQLARLNLLHT